MNSMRSAGNEAWFRRRLLAASVTLALTIGSGCAAPSEGDGDEVPSATVCTVGSTDPSCTGGSMTPPLAIEYVYTSGTTTTGTTVNFTTPNGASVGTVKLSPYGSSGSPVLASQTDSAAVVTHALSFSYLAAATQYRLDISLNTGQTYTGSLATSSVSGPDDVAVAKAIGAYLDEELNPRSVGHSWAVYQFGQPLASGGGGAASLNPYVADTGSQRITVMSMSKTITAAAVMKALEGTGGTVTIDSPILPFLPQKWQNNIGPYVGVMTFRDLLTHTAGLKGLPDSAGDPDSYANLQQIIANGADWTTYHFYSYNNADFCLMRIIIPYLVYGPGAFAQSEANGTNDVATGQAYVNYVKNNVLGPIGLGAIDVVPTGPAPYVQYYSYNAAFGNVFTCASDPTNNYPMLHTGAGYWFMSASEYAHFISSLAQGSIISAASWQIMRDSLDQETPTNTVPRLGLYATGSSSLFAGPYYDHNGGLPCSASDWKLFPNGMAAVFIVNTATFSGASNPQSLLRDAFDLAVAPALPNGGFEGGNLGSWTLTGSASTSSSARTGSYAMMVGSVNAMAGDSSASQTFVAPSWGKLLSFWYKNVCTDSVRYDWATATLADLTAGTTATILPLTCTNHGNWVQVLAQLSPGHQYQLTIIDHDDGAAGDPTYTLVDDVQLLPSYRSWAPLLRRDGFEDGDVSDWWTFGAASSMATASTGACHTGNFCLQLGSTKATNGDSSAATTFVAPVGTSQLSLGYRIVCPDVVNYDWATVTLMDLTANTTTPILPHTCTNTGSWATVTAPVTGEHWYTLTLTSHDDNFGFDPTYTVFDDLTIQ
jgi:CubicO group peptidase (beta-lactamase class C family)